MVKLDYAKIKFRKKNQKALLGALYIYIYFSSDKSAMQSLDKDSKANCLSWLSCNKKNNSLVQKKIFSMAKFC